ncbi:pyrroloquinoline quinone biosynthesis peptide chaperone PqqD [Pseudarthrobacter sp. J75]|uniref:pyrroloquinoline quinone biosynthesis peptide chaperone PqqD n=1 Tax=unclassified Pseudarthrobacter TaxID=2647000 RepID=UPI002E81621D|nr:MULTISPECIES: pyrroloquinoline quinone biosynthesis peptide chaperone PqqD [unclassified Pseudarthrobacter]MEE2523817.1 pyrroloquinoline quinone biosynthesis peptide chaperone PqqD [Pseudarthrobacter sp. J47]MEE2529983.1 pyrroloquinoline quinone biosynthesis peptide chaperone PqqD [Pseudarthrobacter sp. J75]MEE2571045.1 pyrroloquinoline quinone biosynthesis peptide chaperone PqqD [Pseudarthrobacter sp. J64]
METVNEDSRPRLAPHVRMAFNAARGGYALLSPETIWTINATGAAIVELCDAKRTVKEIEAELRRQFDEVAEGDVQRFVAGLVTKHGMEVDHG